MSETEDDLSLFRKRKAELAQKSPASSGNEMILARMRGAPIQEYTGLWPPEGWPMALTEDDLKKAVETRDAEIARLREALDLEKEAHAMTAMQGELEDFGEGTWWNVKWDDLAKFWLQLHPTGEHCGDCTSVPMTCIKCTIERCTEAADSSRNALRRARSAHEGKT